MIGHSRLTEPSLCHQIVDLCWFLPLYISWCRIAYSSVHCLMRLSCFLRAWEIQTELSLFLSFDWTGWYKPPLLKYQCLVAAYVDLHSRVNEHSRQDQLFTARQTGRLLISLKPAKLFGDLRYRPANAQPMMKPLNTSSMIRKRRKRRCGGCNRIRKSTSRCSKGWR